MAKTTGAAAVGGRSRCIHGRIETEREKRDLSPGRRRQTSRSRPPVVLLPAETRDEAAAARGEVADRAGGEGIDARGATPRPPAFLLRSPLGVCVCDAWLRGAASGWRRGVQRGVRGATSTWCDASNMGNLHGRGHAGVGMEKGVLRGRETAHRVKRRPATQATLVAAPLASDYACCFLCVPCPCASRVRYMSAARV